MQRRPQRMGGRRRWAGLIRKLWQAASHGGHAVVERPPSPHSLLCPCSQVAEPEGGATRLVVGNLTRNVTEEHLHEIFSTYGKLKNVELAIDKQVNLPRGFAHVEYDEHVDAQKAIDFMHEGQIDGNVIRCVGQQSASLTKLALGLCPLEMLTYMRHVRLTTCKGTAAFLAYARACFGTTAVEHRLPAKLIVACPSYAGFFACCMPDRNVPLGYAMAYSSNISDD